MKRSIVAVVFLAVCSSAVAQLSIADFNSYEENFNASEPGAPENWSIAGFAGTGASLVYGGSTNNNTYYLLSPGSEAEDTAFGGKVAASGANGTLTLSAINDTGVGVASFSVSWDYLQYTAHNRASTVSFSYSVDGGVSYVTSGVTVSSGGLVYTAAELTGVSTGSGSPTSVVLTSSTAISIALVDSLAVGDTILFRYTWANGAGGGNNAHLGVDNFSFTAIPVPEPSAYAAIAGALVLSSVLVRRRRRLFTIKG